MNNRSFAPTIKRIVEMVRPDLSAYMRFPLQAKVTAVDVENYTCDVQPLDEMLPPLPRCRVLSPWATTTMRLVVLPAVDDQVLVGFENGDPDKPFILGFLPDQGPDGTLLIEAGSARITIAQDGTVSIESDTKMSVNAPAIDLGADAVEAVIKGNTFQQLFNAHQHIGNQGAPTSTPVQPLDGSELSAVTKTE